MTYSTLLASAARTASGVSDEFTVPNGTQAIMVQENVTAAATEVDDILAMWLQGSLDGTTFFDIGRFADVLGNGGAKKVIMVISRKAAAETELLTGTDASMAASTVTQGPFPDLLRVKYTVTDAGADNASFTFSVSVGLIR